MEPNLLKLTIGPFQQNALDIHQKLFTPAKIETLRSPLKQDHPNVLADTSPKVPPKTVLIWELVRENKDWI